MKFLVLGLVGCLSVFISPPGSEPALTQSRSPAKLVIKVSLQEKETLSTVVRDFDLLIQKKESDASDSIVSSLRVKTAADGSVSVALLPGAYTIKSENPLLVGDKVYEWEITFKVRLGAPNLLELSSQNVTITPAYAVLKDGRITWADYVSQMRPVVHLLAIPEVSATGKSVFWNILKAGALALLVPADYKFKVNFQEMFLTCDGKPVVPIQRGRIEFVSDLPSYHRVKSRHAYAGLYTYPIEIFDPQRCKQLSLKITSEENSVTPENKLIEQRLVQQVWTDFEPYRAGRSR